LPLPLEHGAANFQGCALLIDRPGVYYVGELKVSGTVGPSVTSVQELGWNATYGRALEQAQAAAAQLGLSEAHFFGVSAC
jgi:hypothetical protein